MNFLKTYRQIGKDFIKPKLHWFFGSWRKEPNLPVWRHGNIIYFGKYWEYDSSWRGGKLLGSWWTEQGKKNHPILSRIFKPVYQLHYWLSFYFFDADICYKTKWSDNDFRYEFASHITLVLFGFAISVTAYVPKDSSFNDFTCNDDYWESMLTYDYYGGDLEKTNSAMGYYNKLGTERFRFVFQPRFLKDPEKQKQLYNIQNEFYKKLLDESKPNNSWDK